MSLICKKHGLEYHYYADDGQLYLSFKPTCPVSKNDSLDRVQSFLAEIVTWMNNNMLKINADKTEVIIFTSQRNQQHVETITVTIGDENIKPSNSVRNLGAILDNNMTLEKHINSVCRSCYGQLRQIGHIRKYLNTDATKFLVNSLVTSRMDYCYALLYGVPKTTLNKLQHLQNTAARIITGTSRFEHITPVLKKLHWIPVVYRVDFKILMQTYKALHDQSPIYLKHLLALYQPTRNFKATLLLAESKTDLRDALNAMSEYCNIWNLVVNEAKTKVVVFSKSKPKDDFDFMYNGISKVITKENRSSMFVDISKMETFRKQEYMYIDNSAHETSKFNASNSEIFCKVHSNWYQRYFSTKVTTNFSSWTFEEEQNCSSINITQYIQKIQPKLTFALKCDGKTVQIGQTPFEDEKELDGTIPCFNFGDKCLKAYLNKCCKDNRRVPNIVHYVSYKKSAFSFFDFVCFISVIRFVRPCVILIHGDALPSGPFWNKMLKLSPNIIHVRQQPPNNIFGKAILYKEHTGDFMRIEALILYGGIYLDTDTVIVKSLEPLRKYPCTMSKQGGYMASSFIMAEKNALFLRKWFDGYKYHYNNNSYVFNAMIYPNRIYKNFPDSIHVENGTISRLVNQIGPSVYEINYNWAGIYGFHLFRRSYRKPITVDSVKYFNSTVGSICRHVLFGNKELCF
ncbi:uncharacterized protein LOC132756992 [Ruditapes philippinarum]|uniref:uncharacterized protein LOC132756992 n=1 Tax=Ruditapes philippinarum TaxID=129788 RepID=UPI00295B068F|nr:uncharacterized protein LOC132756992 [Ruditapes philippinarum]